MLTMRVVGVLPFDTLNISRNLCRMSEDLEDLADGVVLFERVPQRNVEMQLVAVATAIADSHHITASLELG